MEPHSRFEHFDRATDDRDVKAPLADFMSAAQSADGLWGSDLSRTMVLGEDRISSSSTSSSPSGDISGTRREAQESVPARHGKSPMVGQGTPTHPAATGVTSTAAAVSVWNCARCTFRNEKHINFCEICQAKHPMKQSDDSHNSPAFASTFLSSESMFPKNEATATSSSCTGGRSANADADQQPLPLRQQPSQQRQQPFLFSIVPSALRTPLSAAMTSTSASPQRQKSCATSPTSPGPFAWPSLSQLIPKEWHPAGLFGQQPTSGNFVESPPTSVFQPLLESQKKGASPPSSKHPPEPLRKKKSLVVCSLCHSHLDASLFSSNQLKKRVFERKCAGCVRKLMAVSGCTKTQTSSQSAKDADLLLDFARSAESSAEVSRGGELESLPSGTRSEVCIEDLEFMHQIGAGGYGKVLVARHKKLGRHYAVKVLNFRKEATDEETSDALVSVDASSSSSSPTSTNGGDDDDDDEWTTLGVARDNNAEEEILSSVSSHPFITSLLGCFREEKRKLLVFELASGDLYHKLTESHGSVFSRELTVFYAAQLLLAIDHLHTRGIIHKDIKLDNILLGSDGYITLSDFGSATRVAADNNYTMASKDCFIGTVMFSAPELVRESFFHYAEYCDAALIRNLSRESLEGDQPCSFQVDYWSFGTAVFEMLTGKSPFDHIDEDEEEDDGGDDDSMIDTVDNLVSSSDGENGGEKAAGVPKDAADFIKQGKDVLDCRYTCPPDMDVEARHFVQSLLERNPTKRLGANGAAEVMRHPFFKNVDWRKLALKELPPHMMPSS